MLFFLKKKKFTDPTIANPLILAPGARLFHIAGAVGLLIAAFLFNGMCIDYFLIKLLFVCLFFFI